MCFVVFCVSVLDRLQSFLPQMADANEKLKQQMEGAPAGFFDIESVEEAQRIIEMVSVSVLVLHAPTAFVILLIFILSYFITNNLDFVCPVVVMTLLCGLFRLSVRT